MSDDCYNGIKLKPKKISTRSEASQKHLRLQRPPGGSEGTPTADEAGGARAAGTMESSSPSVPFPLLQAPVESTYRACTIPYRFTSDNPRKATPVEIQWIDLFLNSVPSFK